MKKTPSSHGGSWLPMLWQPVGTSLLVLVVSFALAGHSASLDSTVILSLINLIMVVGLYIFVGTAGIVSFGQVSFMAIGAYVCGMFTLPAIAKPVIIPNAPGLFLDTNLGTTTGILAGALAAALFAAFASVALMRLSGIGASIGTLALLVITFTFFDNWQPGNSGGGNLTRVPTDVSVNSASIWAVVAILVAFGYKRSRFGLRLRAARDDDSAARASGVRIRRERRTAFIISAFWFGVAGGLYGHTIGSFSANDFFLDFTFITLAMLVVGGATSILGAVTGATFLSVVSYILGQWENRLPALGVTLRVPTGTRDLVLATVLIAALLLRPNGLIENELAWPPRFAVWLQRKARGRAAASGSRESDAPGEPDRPEAPAAEPCDVEQATHPGRL